MKHHDVKILEEYWDVSGFFYQLRQGDFDYKAYTEFLLVLKRMEPDESITVEKRIVSLLWFIPVFMRWQTERVAEKGADMEIYRRAEDEIVDELIRILGIP